MLLRIVFVCSSAATVRGGIETTVNALATELSRRNEVTLLTGGRRRVRGVHGTSGVHVIELPFVHRSSTATRVLGSASKRYDPYLTESLSFFASVLVSPQARREIAKAEVVSTHTKYDSLTFSPWVASKGIATVFHIQGSKFGHVFRAFDRTTRYVSVSLSTRRDLAERCHIPVAATVSPGIPEQLLSLPRREGDFLLFVSRLQRSKGTLEVVRVFSRILRQFPRLRLVVVGDGPGREQMENEARRLSVRERTAFMGTLHPTEIWQYYARARVLLFPSRSEVFPLVPLEAIATGCPVIASDLPGVTESTGGYALLVPPDDLDLWTTKTVEVLDDVQKRKAAVDAGRAWARGHTWAKVAELYERELLLAREAVAVRRKSV